MTRLISLGSILTDGEIKRCNHIWRVNRKNFHKRVVDEIVRKALPRINEKLGQECDEDYIAYAIEFALMTIEG